MLKIRATLPIARAMLDQLSTLIDEVVGKGPWHHKYVDDKVKLVEALASALEELYKKWNKDLIMILESFRREQELEKSSGSIDYSSDLPSIN